MNTIDFSFEESAIDVFLASVCDGDTVSAVDVLTLLEEEEEDGVEEILQTLGERNITLDLSDFPRGGVQGEAALRLRTEEQLVANGMRLDTLDPTDPLRLYLEEIAMTPTCEDVEVLAAEAEDGDEKSELRLIEACLGSVVETAKEHVGYGVLLLDLIQEGSLGLLQSIQNRRDGSFFAYANRAVRFSMAKAVLLQARQNGTGQKMRTALEDYRSVDEQLLVELGRNPTIEEIAEKLHLSVENTAIVQKMLENVRLLAQAKKIPEESEEEIAETQAVEDTAYFRMRQRIADLLSELDESDAKLLTLRYGLEGGLPMSVDEVGRKLGMTPDEVLAREAQSLQILRKS